MKLLVGIGLSEHDRGAVRFAGWLGSHSEVADPVRALHALNPAAVKVALTRTTLEQIETDVRDVARRAIDGSGVEHLEVILDGYPEVALNRLGTAAGVDAIVVGRHAKRGEDPLVRLGKVARRLLRSLDHPTIVVRPDFGCR